MNDTLVFFRDLHHLPAAKAVGNGVPFGCLQISVFISFQFPVKCILAPEGKIIPAYFYADRYSALPGRRDTGCSLQGDVYKRQDRKVFVPEKMFLET